MWTDLCLSVSTCVCIQEKNFIFYGACASFQVLLRHLPLICACVFVLPRLLPFCFLLFCVFWEFLLLSVFSFLAILGLLPSKICSYVFCATMFILLVLCWISVVLRASVLLAWVFLVLVLVRELGLWVLLILFRLVVRLLLAEGLLMQERLRLSILSAVGSA